MQSLADVDVRSEFDLALSRFAPLLAAAEPSVWDLSVLEDQSAVIDLAPQDPFDPSSAEDGRLKVLAAVARRQGQAKFRSKLLADYEGKCAITGCDVPDVLQAAHIFPYMGPATNQASNGIILRADIHTLFDLGMIRIEPSSLEISVSAALDHTIYQAYDGKSLRLPCNKASWPSPLALARRWELMS
jgi:predicted restriction endonuclease